MRIDEPESDLDLIERTRAGDREAFAELWRRHSTHARTVARAYTSIDADDLVAEAFTRIYDLLQRGRGPQGGAFRAYLFTIVRNTANRWGRHQSRHTDLDSFETFEHPDSTEQASIDALDRGLTVSAFKSLPTRWQEVLWYSEVEQMKPAEIGPLLGMSANSTSALAYRAREGLRQAWIQAHLKDATEPDCRWSVDRMGAYAREKLSKADRSKLDAHLTDCARCSIVATEARGVSSRLALVLIPLTVGLPAAGAYSAFLQRGGPSPADLAGSAPMPDRITGSISVGKAVAIGSAATLGGLAIAASVAAAIVIATSIGTESEAPAPSAGVESLGAPAAPATPPTQVPAAPHTPEPEPVEPELEVEAAPTHEVALEPSEASPGGQPTITIPATPVDPAPSGPVDPEPGGPVDPEPGGPVDPGEIVLSAPNLADIETGGGLVLPALTGTGMPGATVSVDTGEAVEETAVAEDGSWSLQLATGGIEPITIWQTDDEGRLSERSGPYPLDLQLPAAGVLGNERAVWVELQGVPGALVEFFAEGRSLGRVPLDEAGRFWVFIPGQSADSLWQVRYLVAERYGPLVAATRLMPA